MANKAYCVVYFYAEGGDYHHETINVFLNEAKAEEASARYNNAIKFARQRKEYYDKKSNDEIGALFDSDRNKLDECLAAYEKNLDALKKEFEKKTGLCYANYSISFEWGSFEVETHILEG